LKSPTQASLLRNVSVPSWLGSVSLRRHVESSHHVILPLESFAAPSLERLGHVRERVQAVPLECHRPKCPSRGPLSCLPCPLPWTQTQQSARAQRYRLRWPPIISRTLPRSCPPLCCEQTQRCVHHSAATVRLVGIVTFGFLPWLLQISLNYLTSTQTPYYLPVPVHNHLPPKATPLDAPSKEVIASARPK